MLSEVAYKPVVGFPGYRAGSDGSIWSERHGKWALMKPWVCRNGRPMVDLCRNGKRIHRLVSRTVLEAFAGSCPEGMECCHFPDRDPKNNAIQNLRWDTKKANQADSALHGTKPIGERHARCKITEATAREVQSLLSRGTTAPAMCKALNGAISPASVYSIKYRRTWEKVADDLAEVKV